MNGNELLDKISLSDPAFIEEAEAKAAKHKSKYTWLKWGAAAAACIAAAIGAIALIPWNGSHEQSTQLAPIVLSERSTVSVYDGYEETVKKSKLYYLSEKEMFSMADRCIFRGRVFGLRNIIIEYDGEKQSRCIASISVEKVYKGNISTDGGIDVLLPFGVSFTSNWAEDTGVISQIDDCKEGIFIVKKYAYDEYETLHGGVIYLTDLAPYGITDGLRWVFLATDKALVFDRDSYLGARSANNLDDIEKYVIDMLKRYGSN